MKNLIIVVAGDFNNHSFAHIIKADINSLGEELQRKRLKDILIYSSTDENHVKTAEIINKYLKTECFQDEEILFTKNTKLAKKDKLSIVMDYLLVPSHSSETVILVVNVNYATDLVLACADLYIQKKLDFEKNLIKSCDAMVIDLEHKTFYKMIIRTSSFNKYNHKIY
ncbi:MAG: hypothetical protein NT068_03445 [Candidatus Nomurabacteria bacterium]|nr:hypothetical protein [Candidatus Nomurabacteria bacterium]